MSELSAKYRQEIESNFSSEFSDAYARHNEEQKQKQKRLDELQTDAEEKLAKFKEGLIPDNKNTESAREVGLARSIQGALKRNAVRHVRAEQHEADRVDKLKTKKQQEGLDAFLAEQKLKKLKSITPSKAALEARAARAADLHRRKMGAKADRIMREYTSAKVRAERLAYAKASAKAREATGHDEFASYEVSDQPTQVLEKAEKPANKNVTRRAELDQEDEQVTEQAREKTKLWKNLVETYLAGGEQGLEEELFDPRREGKVLTREILEKDKPLQKQLEVMFAADRAQRTLQDFIMAMPTEEDYVANAMKRMRDAGDANADQKVGLPDRGVLAELEDIARNYKPDTNYQEPVSGEINNNNTFVSNFPEESIDSSYAPQVKQGVKDVGEYLVRQDKHEKRPAQLAKDKKEFLSDFDNSAAIENIAEIKLAEQAQKAYVDAYRAYDAKATKDKSDDLVAMLKPPFFALSRAARELKQLYASMTERNKVLLASDQIGKNLAASDLAKPRAGLRSDLAAAAAESNRREESTVSVRQQKINAEVDKALDVSEKGQEKIMPIHKFFTRKTEPGETAAYLKRVQEKSGMNPNFSSPLTRELKNKTVKESIKQIGDQRVEGMKRRMQEIELYFADKNPEAKTKTARQYLLGSDIKGWFKGEQKRLQQEYKDLYNNDLYQKYLQK